MENNNITDVVKKTFPGAVIDNHCFRGDETIILKKESIYPVCRFLRDDENMLFNFMMDVTAVDYLGRDVRFEVVYHLYSLRHNRRIRLKVPVDESDCNIDSIVSLWEGANWFEREAYDMYGVVFNGHPDMRRIIMWDGFEGHPLRKDYPVNKRQPQIGPQN